MQNTLSKVIQLKGVSYFFNKEDFKDKNFNDNKQVGLIAQEVEKIYPELVQTDEQGFKSIDYAKLTPILVEAIKELKMQNDILKEDNIQLKTSVQN
ncbi:MAG: tail fiber domain-containing protein [Saprospirales bacterium]|nr:tail fiber domain-containing protein [Saprospirales bacterium]